MPAAAEQNPYQVDNRIRSRQIATPLDVEVQQAKDRESVTSKKAAQLRTGWSS